MLKTLDSVAPSAKPLIQLLQQQASVIARLTDHQYAAKPVGPVNASIGGHVRHCLDHVQALIMASETGTLDYDHRDRDTQIESCRLLALGLIRELERQLTELPEEVMDQPLEVTLLLTPDEPAITVQSSFGRELAYVLSHTVHHNAIIGTIVKILGGWLPEHFGYAPSTIAYWKNKACAR